MNSSSPEAILRATEEHKVTNIVLSPRVLLSLETSSSFSKTDLSSLENVIVTGAALSKEDEARCGLNLKTAAPKAEVCQVR